jgi:hypothetical protein
MHSDDEKILRMAKEVAIKFIELGRVSPTNFEDHFRTIFWAIKKTVVDARALEFTGETVSGETRESSGEEK